MSNEYDTTKELNLNGIEFQLSCYPDSDDVILVITDMNSLKTKDFEVSIGKHKLEELADFINEFATGCEQ